MEKTLRKRHRIMPSKNTIQKAVLLFLLIVGLTPQAMADYWDWGKSIRITQNVDYNGYIEFSFYIYDYRGVNDCLDWASIYIITKKGKKHIMEFKKYDVILQKDYDECCADYKTFHDYNDLRRRTVRLYLKPEFYKANIVKLGIEGYWNIDCNSSHHDYHGSKEVPFRPYNIPEWTGYSDPNFKVRSYNGKSSIKLLNKTLKDENGQEYFQMYIPYSYHDGAFGYLKNAKLWCVPLDVNGWEYHEGGNYFGTKILDFSTSISNGCLVDDLIIKNKNTDFGTFVKSGVKKDGALKYVPIKYYPTKAFLQKYHNLKQKQGVDKIGMHFEFNWKQSYYWSGTHTYNNYPALSIDHKSYATGDFNRVESKKLKYTIQAKPNQNYKANYKVIIKKGDLIIEEKEYTELSGINDKIVENIGNKDELIVEEYASHGRVHTINNTEIDYTFPYELVKTHTIKACAYPKNITFTTDVWNKKITIKWDAETTDRRTEGKWYIYRYQIIDGQLTDGKYINSIAFNSTKSYTDTDNELDYDTEYKYIVYFALTDWSNSEDNIVEDLSSSGEVILDRAGTLNDAFSLELEANSNNMKVLINHPKNVKGKDFHLKYQEQGNLNIMSSGSQFTDATQTEMTVTGLNGGCSMYDFWIETELLGNNVKSDTVEGNVSVFTKINNLDATKGIYKSKNVLKWDVNKVGAETHKYSVYRRTAESDEDWIGITDMESAEKFFTYNDDNVSPGVFYEYKVRVSSTKSTCKIYNESPIDIGYSLSTGSVSGLVSYGTGTAVEGVRVNLIKGDGNNNTDQFKSLSINLGSGKQGMACNFKSKAKRVFSKDFSLQIWVKPDSVYAGNKFFIVKNQMFELYVNPDYTIGLTVGANTKTTTKKIMNNKFTHISLVRSTSNNYILYIVNDLNKVVLEKYIIGKYDSDWKDSEDQLLYFGGNGEQQQVAGNIDDIRLWTKALDSAEIMNTYSRIIPGDLENLEIYAPIDEGLNKHAFDISSTNGLRNSNHFEIYTGSKSSSIIPKHHQLGLYGITDNNGSYLVRGIPFKGAGDMYSVKPSFGIHRFKPDKQSLFISNQSLEHNKIDFEDISSFKVEGIITYANGDYPVEGVQLNIDGVAASRDGEIILSDREGKYSIDVPIGDHFISVSKQGHVFVNQGRYPANKLTYHTFNKPLSNLNFRDTTLVRIAGRVVGGEREAKKPLGFGKSKANIGKATIVLSPQNTKYKLNHSGKDVEISHDEHSILSTTTVKNDATQNQITIETDASTGEFLALLPPIKYKVVSIKTEGISTNEFKNKLPPAFLPDVNMEASDSLNDKKFKCNKRLDITYRVEPKIEINNVGEDVQAFGDKFYIYSKIDGSSDTIPLYTIKNGKLKYTLNKPVFTKQNIYSWKVYAYEKYANYDNTDTVYDNVPLTDKYIDVNNALASTTLYVEKNDSIANSSGKLQLDSAGVAIYKFAAGFPNMSGNHLLTAKLSYNNSGKTITKELEGYVFGSIPVPGSNFVTQGPDLVDYVLRDPSGSNSSAYLEKGSVISTTTTISKVEGVHSTVNSTVSLGGTVSTATGLGVAVIIETAANFDISANYESNASWENSESGTTRTEIQRRISTSDADDYVGAMADVYIGKSTNIIYGKVNSLGLFPINNGDYTSNTGQKYKLSNNEILSTGIEFNTVFNYTQNHIIDYLIPNLEKLRNNLISKENIDANSFVNTTGKTVYVSKVSEDNENYGKKGYYTAIYDKNKKKKIQVDEVQNYNNWIKNWENRIFDNEKAKIESFAKDPERNLSFDAGTKIEESINQVNDTSHIDNYTFEMEAGIGLETGFSVAKAGINLATTQAETHHYNKETNTTEEDSKMFGFTLADDSQGDYYSIDLYNPTDKGGYIFRTRAGQSSCPYEAPEYTKYYQPEKKHLINSGTFQVEKPVIYVDNTKNATAENISAGREASFELQLSNQSEADLDVSYELSVQSGTNPDGLIFKIDGAPLTVPRKYNIAAGTTINKKLKITQSSLDVLEYNNVNLILTSTCQNDPTSDVGWVADSAKISLVFIPSSSPLTLKLPTTVINKGKNTEEKPILTYQVSDYQRNFKHFGAIRLQYKLETEQNWALAKEFINDSTIIHLNENNTFIEENFFSYDFDMSDLPDGVYDVRAISVSKIGVDEIIVETPTQKIVKDMVPPQVLGKTNPASGILTSNDEISVVFNENINANALTYSNFIVKGVLNGYKVDHSTAIKFQSNSKAETEAKINLARRDFTVEMWIKYYGGSGILFSTENNDGSFKLFTNNDKKLILSIDGKTYISDDTLRTNKWMYLAFVYDYKQFGSTFTANYVYDASEINLFKEKPVADYNGNGRLIIGENLKASIHELSIWDEARDFGQRAMYNAKYPSTYSLIGYWPFNEGHATLAKDFARSRHMTLSASSLWHIETPNKAVELTDSSYLSKDISKLATAKNEDYAIEIWFKAEVSSKASTLFSSDNKVIAVGFSKTGKLQFFANKKQYDASDNYNYFDGQWHHLALNVLYSGNANVYIDGVSKIQVNSANVPELQGAILSIGAQHDYNKAGNKFVYSSYFTGAVDELRVWHASKTIESIRLDIFNRLHGNEIGLKAYYPFEKHGFDSGNQAIITGSLENIVEKDDDIKLAAGKIKYSDLTPPLREVRPEENVKYSFVASERKIVINLTEENARTENCTLTFQIKDASDMHNNQASPIIWSAYVNQNRLKWDEKEISIAKEVSGETTFSLNISNLSGLQERWTINNVPDWLKPSKKQGTLSPISSEELTFTVQDNVPIGTYDQTMYLQGSNKVSAPLIVNLKVTGKKPDWKVVKDESSMNAIGQIQIKGMMSEDSEDIIAAFIDSKCVGITSPKYYKRYDAYIVMMDIYGNSNMQGKKVTFKVWDASTGNIYTQVEPDININYNNNAVFGSLAKPVIWNVIDVVEQILNLSKGWNWISINANADDMSVAGILKSVKLNARLVKTKMQFTVPDGSSWTKGIDTLSVDKMYKVRMSAQRELKIIGKEVKPKEMPIKINSKWNWIAYSPRFVLPVGAAFSDLGPIDGDIVKGQSQFAVFTGYEWVGSLTSLMPGKGYLYKSNANVNKSFTYPSRASVVASNNKRAKATSTTKFTTVSQNEYSGNMTMIAIVQKDGKTLTNVEVGLFTEKNECRAAAQSDSKGKVFLTILGDDKVSLSFKVVIEDKIVAVEQTIDYTDDAMIGSISEPYVIKIASTTGIDNNIINDGNSNIEVYPTITDNKVIVTAENVKLNRITVTDINGKIYLEEKNPTKYNTLVIENLTNGMYLVSVYHSDNQRIVKRVIKQ